MAQANWRLAAGIVGLIAAALLVQRLTRRVTAFHPPPDRDLSEWGSFDAETAQQMQSILDNELNALRVPAMQAFVRTADGRTWSGTSGTIDLGRKTLLRREHVMRVGSTTKSFTAVVVLQLVEEGRLALDDPLSTWFPDIPQATRITVRQLLNHTSGIPEFLQNPEVIMKSILPHRKWRPEDMIAIALKSEPEFAPGEGWSYSNTNFVLLGLIAERVTGQTAAQLLRARIIDPLDLRNTYFIPYEPPPRTLVTGFDRDLSRFPGMLDIAPGNTSWATAAFTSGALASTADDLGTFYHSLFAGEMLSTFTAQQMTTFVQADNPGFEAQNGYGLGLIRLEAGGQEYVGHVGEFMGSTAIAMHASDTGNLIVLTSNLSFPDLVGTLVALHAAIAE